MAEAIITSGIIMAVMVVCGVDWVKYEIHRWKARYEK